MATDAPITGAPTCASTNVVPFQRREEPLVYDPGVTPFDRTNPVHVRAWNTLFALGWREANKEGR